VPLTRDHHYELTVGEVNSMLPELVGLPMRTEHDGETVGAIREAFWHGGDVFISFDIDGEHAEFPKRLVEVVGARGLSLRHRVVRDSTGQHLTPYEVSICFDGARKGTGICSDPRQESRASVLTPVETEVKASMAEQPTESQAPETKVPETKAEAPDTADYSGLELPELLERFAKHNGRCSKEFVNALIQRVAEQGQTLKQATVSVAKLQKQAEKFKERADRATNQQMNTIVAFMEKFLKDVPEEDMKQAQDELRGLQPASHFMDLMVQASANAMTESRVMEEAKTYASDPNIARNLQLIRTMQTQPTAGATVVSMDVAASSNAAPTQGTKRSATEAGVSDDPDFMNASAIAASGTHVAPAARPGANNLPPLPDF